MGLLRLLTACLVGVLAGCSPATTDTPLCNRCTGSNPAFSQVVGRVGLEPTTQGL